MIAICFLILVIGLVNASPSLSPVPGSINNTNENHEPTTVTVLMSGTSSSGSNVPSHHRRRYKDRDELAIECLKDRGRGIIQSCGRLPPPPPEDLEFEAEIGKLKNLLRGCALNEAHSQSWRQNLPPETIKRYLRYLQWQDDYLGRVMGKIQLKLASPEAIQLKNQSSQVIRQGTVPRQVIQRKRIVRRTVYGTTTIQGPTQVQSFTSGTRTVQPSGMTMSSYSTQFATGRTV